METTEDKGQRITARFYTSARRFKQVLGSLPDGTKIPGGPYTYTQFGVMFAVLACAWLTRGIWGGESAIRDLILSLIVAYGMGVLVGKLPSSRRGPLQLAGGASTLMSHPGPGGKYQGRPLRLSPKAKRIYQASQKAAKERKKRDRKPAASATHEPVEELEPAAAKASLATAGYGSSLHRLLTPTASERNTH